jgi:NodT family efflux transporter outer membrane factor (OMF) lipoprotein
MSAPTGIHALSIALAVGLAGCAVTPTANLERAPGTPPTWSQAAPAFLEAEPADAWWLAVRDPLLHELVAAAGEIASVRIAAERLEEARAALRSATAQLAPNVVGGASAVSSRPGDDASRQLIASASATATWDVDLSGSNRVRHGAAEAQVRARGEGVDAARISARAAAARLYVAHAVAGERVVLARRSVAALDDALALAAARARAGLAADFDVVQARAALAAARAAIPRLAAARDSARLGLEALLGRPAGSLRERLESVADVPQLDSALALRTPLAVLAARPDLRAAEHDLAAASAITAASVRDRWPRLVLSGVLGEQSVRFASPFSGTDGLIRTLAGSVTGPLFDFDRLAALEGAARARERSAAAGYRQAVIDAFAEVETGLMRFARAAEEIELTLAATAAAQRRVELATSRYRVGLSSFLDVVLAEQALHAAAAEHAIARSGQLDAWTGLAAAMGLGRATSSP